MQIYVTHPTDTEPPNRRTTEPPNHSGVFPTPLTPFIPPLLPPSLHTLRIQLIWHARRIARVLKFPSGKCLLMKEKQLQQQQQQQQLWYKGRVDSWQRSERRYITCSPALNHSPNHRR